MIVTGDLFSMCAVKNIKGCLNDYSVLLFLWLFGLIRFFFVFTMSDFYLTLPSNSSMSQYPDNHGGHFYTKLPQSIDLSAMAYEVGLAEIQYPNTYSNVEADDAWLIYEAGKKQGMQLITVPEGLYCDAEAMIESLNSLIRKNFSPMGDKNPYIKFFYNDATKRATLKLYKVNH